MTDAEFADIIEEKCLIVLDTSTIFALYRYSSNTSSDILNILKKCMPMLWIPHQVYQEYDKNKYAEKDRANKKYVDFKKELKAIISNANQSVSKRIREAKKHEYPSCDNLETELKDGLNSLNQVIENYYKSIEDEQDQNAKAVQITNVMGFIQALFDSKQVGSPIGFNQRIEILREGELRYRYKIPPGYADEEKKIGVEKFGDLFVWKEIINIPKIGNAKNVLFVTNDCKEDWWIKSGNKCKHIRSELLDEFSAVNEHCNIHLLTLKDFFEHSSVYYKFQSLSSELELNSNTYIARLFEDYNLEIFKEMEKYVYQIDYPELDGEFSIYNDSETMLVDVEMVSYDFRIENDHAIYCMTIELPGETDLYYEDNEGDSFKLGNVQFTVETIVEISQQILISENKLDEKKEIEYVYFDLKDIKILNPYDLYYDGDEELTEPNDAEEEHYRHH